MLVCTFFNACSTYSPLVDTIGRSGTFDTDQAKEITNNIQHCDKIAKDNTNFISNITFYDFIIQ